MVIATEYWVERTLYEIAGDIGTPLLIDNVTNNRLFGHYAKVLVDLDPSGNIFTKLWWNRKVMHFQWKLNTRGCLTFALTVKVLDII